MKVTFDVRGYEASHAKLPRGRGSWAFSTEREPRSDDEILWAHGTFSEARREATAYFKKFCAAHGIKRDVLLHVLP